MAALALETRLPSPRRLVQAAFALIALTAIGTAVAPATLARTPVPRVRVTVHVDYRLPFAAGQTYTVTQGWHGSYSHTGKAAYAYDFGLPQGTPVLAAAAGVVAYVEDGHRACGGESLADKANFVTIYHADGTATQYAHLSKIEVTVGQVVTSGQEIGRSGKVGFTGCAPHLHFARQAQGRAVTQSIPVYFVETGHRRLPRGANVTSQNPGCSQASTGLPDGSFCGIYTIATGLGPLRVSRLDRAIAVGTRTPTRDGAAPTPGSVLAATWIGRFVFASSGMFTLTLTSGGDVRLWIDGNLAIDAPAVTTPNGEASLWRWMAAGQHVIKVEYVAGSGSGVGFDWRETGSDGAARTNI